jgi:surface antigen
MALCFLVLAVLLTVVPGQAQATVNDYPWQGADPNQISPLRFYYRNCTDFVAWRLNKQVGVTSAPWRFTWSNLAGPGGNGNAIGWKDGAISRGYQVDNTPRIGSVAWWGASRGGGLGHVAVVSSINPDGSVNIEQYNATPYAYSTQTNVRAEAYLHIADTNINRDVSGDGRADLVLINTGPTGSGRLEAHVLDAATGYSTWYAHWATAAGYGSPADPYLLGDVNGDGRPDLTVVAPGPTGSGRLEAHVLDGATGYSTWLAHWATTAGYGGSADRYVMGDVNGDGRSDLVIVATGPTGSGRLEAHVLDAATGYSTWLAHWATAAGYGDATTAYAM